MERTINLIGIGTDGDRSLTQENLQFMLVFQQNQELVEE